MATKVLPHYAVWNNKGGVGKSFLTFIMATEYAVCHPDEHVVVVDMCPQANVSEILLGGNGAGSTALSTLLTKTPRQTIGGYFDARITSPHIRTGTELNFVVDLHSFNNSLPSNMSLVAGDPSLEIQAQAINQIAVQTLPANSWANVHSWVSDIVAATATQHPNSVFFIDCNPSFAAYTEIALLASTRLIIPCTADGSSARAIDNVGQLLYGVGVPPAYSSVNFAARAKNFGIGLPAIHMVPLNRSTQYDKKSSKAFGAMYDEIKSRVVSLNASIPNSFSCTKTNCFLDIPDAHAVSVVCSHLGLPLSSLKVKRYQIHTRDTQVNSEPLSRYTKAVGTLVGLL